ncbi:MAG: DUF4332 domain-containing protein [Planctomycetota bacterium]|jgi:predicted flap endonuclease-1-like 5' DNA nuclease
MSYNIEAVEGIGPAHRTKLHAAGIRSTRDFLRLCCDERGRKSVSEGTGVSRSLLLKWANLADLMRISGIGPQYSELLEAAGVDTVKELRHRKPENLAAKMKQVNATRRLTRNTPPLSLVTQWVDQARSMDALITH